MNTCQAKTRAGTPCKQPAGWGTKHVGEGRCKLHGGNGGAPIKHGLYSKYREHLVGERIMEILEDPDLMDMRRPVALIEALTQRLLEHAAVTNVIDQPTRQALAQLASQQVTAMKKFYEVTEGTKHTIRYEFIQVFLGQVAVIINEEVKDPATRARISERLGGISILTN